MRGIGVALSVSSLAVRVCVGQVPALERFEQARRLESTGRLEEAFTAYLEVPGAEYASARIARPAAREFLAHRADLLASSPDLSSQPRATLVRGDLLLAAGDRDGALECYRGVAHRIGREPGQGWEQGLMPHDYYPVEPPHRQDFKRLALPFALGCGSHRDNWLVRRLIALEAWQDAAVELDRVWRIHGRRAGERQFDGLGLQFALDYAYFLRRQGHEGQMLHVLLEALLRMDMDHDPNRPGQPRVSVAFAFGFGDCVSRRASRDDFIRLAIGVFREAGQEDTLVQELTKRIARGQNSARRVLAQIHRRQSRFLEAPAQELAYVEAGGFGALSSAYRRGLAYESVRRFAEAATEYETALRLPYASPQIPDDEEAAVRRSRIARALAFDPDGKQRPAEALFRAKTFERLQTMYAWSGQGGRAREAAIRQFEACPFLLDHFALVRGAADKLAPNRKHFLEWAKQRVPHIGTPMAQANLYWFLDDPAAAARALAEARSQGRVSDEVLRRWRCRFGSKRRSWLPRMLHRLLRVGEDRRLLLLQALVEMNPGDARARLELLDLDDGLGPDQVLRHLEALLDPDGPDPFSEGYPGGRFGDVFDLAYRAMRHYERRGEIARLRTLGLRIASAERPFQMVGQSDLSQFQTRGGNGLPEHLNACLALAIQHADAPTLSALEKALDPTPRRAAKAQVARRRSHDWAPAPAWPWANVPSDVRVMACNEHILSLAVDDRFIYAGQPWGVAVYTHQGRPVVRVALALAAHDLLVHHGWLWVATPKGLYRITVGSWEVAHLPFEHDLPRLRRKERRKRHRKPRYNPAYALAGDGQFIWIGTRWNIQRIDLQTTWHRVYTREQLSVSGESNWTRFIIDGDHAWASTETGRCARYDRRSDTWTPVSRRGNRVRLIGLADGVVWGSVPVHGSRRDRACSIDRRTLVAALVPIEWRLEPGPSHVDARRRDPFAHFGAWRGQAVLGCKRPSLYYDAGTGKLRALPRSAEGRTVALDSDLLPGLRLGQPWRKPNGVIVCQHSDPRPPGAAPNPRLKPESWTMARLPDGSIVLGSRCQPEPHDRRPGGAWDTRGGLYLISADRTVKRISSAIAGSVLPGAPVTDAIFTPGPRNWVCTHRGVAVLDREGSVLAHFTRSDGLCADRVTGGAALGGRVYFATGWGCYGGGLAVYDPATSVFTSLTQSDGLPANKLAAIRPRRGKLELLCSPNCGSCMSPRGRLSVLDPRSGRVKGACRLWHGAREKVRKMVCRTPPQEPMPYLGGPVLSELRHEGKTYLCGTQGLVIRHDRAALPPLTAPRIRMGVCVEPMWSLREAAKKLELHPDSMDRDLRRLLEDENPCVRTKAMAAMSSRPQDLLQWLPLISSQSQHPHLCVRWAALRLLTQIDDESVVPVLREHLRDPDRRVRGAATLGLLRKGHVPEAEHLKELLTQPSGGWRTPCWRPLAFARPASREEAYQAIAPHADRDVLALLVHHPLRVRRGDSTGEEILRELGRSLVKHPDAAEVLLRARDGRRPSQFAPAVFGHAGKALLPVLHSALAASDRTVRANAARACAAIGDASSIPHLIAALRRETGLRGKSIVWALGELKADAALPDLIALQLDQLDLAKLRPGPTCRSVFPRPCDTELRDLDHIGREWPMLRADTNPPGGMELVGPWDIAEAVKRMGAAATEELRVAIESRFDKWQLQRR